MWPARLSMKFAGRLGSATCDGDLMIRFGGMGQIEVECPGMVAQELAGKLIVFLRLFVGLVSGSDFPEGDHVAGARLL